MDISIYNSLTRQKEKFIPIQKGAVGMYVCGPTVYGPPHVGHARSYVCFDVIRRFFEYAGYKVKYVQNITDVGHLVGDTDEGEDKIALQAKKENLDPYEVSYKYETQYFDNMDKLGVERPSISVRATAVIPEMIEMIQQIINKGFAYATKEGNVYFSLGKVKGYGKLSGRKIENGLSGERIEIAQDKQNPEDCALWKSATGGHLMKWNSPWGLGYPGWHIECSAISKKFLGKTFDIHGGGLDNMFPHHETEIAQSEVANGEPFVHYFMHNNLVTVNGTKMGKSLGNFITLDNLFKQFDPMLVRYFILQFHYRKPVDFSESAINNIKPQFEKLKTIFSDIKKIANQKSNKSVEGQIKEIKDDFEKDMCDDFNTPLAISQLLKLAKLSSKIIEDKNENMAQQALYVLECFEKVLGINFSENNVEQPNEASNQNELLNLIQEIRDELRKEKNYQLSDFIRNRLADLNITVNDKKI